MVQHAKTFKNLQLWYCYCRKESLADDAAAMFPGGAFIKNLLDNMPEPKASPASGAPVTNQAGGVMLRRDKDGVGHSQSTLSILETLKTHYRAGRPIVHHVLLHVFAKFPWPGGWQ